MRLARPSLQCAAIILLIATAAFSQTPDSGALLEIHGLVGTTPVDVKVYDSQIHSGVVNTVAVPASVTITSASAGGGNVIYSYSGPAPAHLVVGESIVIATPDANNNGTFTITSVTSAGTFTVANASGVSDAADSGTGTVDSTSGCAAADQIPTDAYVLQGGAPTGCDPGDAFEVTDVVATGDPSNTNVHQQRGELDIAGFHVETKYVCAGANCSGVTGGSGGMCNTSGTICTSGAGPDNGFLTVTNNTGSPFTGTISLKGISPLTGAPDCPTNGMASDTWTSGLTTSGATQSVTLALGSSDPGTADSSNCGGFNQPQLLTLEPGTTVTITAATQSGSNTTYNYTLAGQPDLLGGGMVAVSGMSDPGNNGRFVITCPLPLGTLCGGSFAVVNPNGVTAGPSGTATGQNVYTFGNDTYTFSGFNNHAGDTLSVAPVPTPAGPLGFGVVPPGAASANAFGSETPVSSPLRFSATNYPNQACAPAADFSARLNPVCPELQLVCTSTAVVNDCPTFLYSDELDFTVDAFSLPNGIGGGHFLGDQSDNCPTANFNFDHLYIFKGGDNGFGGRGNPMGCFAATFEPTATPIAVGAVVLGGQFGGFQAPVHPCPIIGPCTPENVVAGSSIPLSWETKDPSTGNPVKLNQCPRQDGTTNGTTACTPPWVFLGFVTVNVATDSTTGTVLDDTTAGTSGLQFVSPFNQYNWQTSKKQKGTCAAPVLGFSSGLWLFPTTVGGGINSTALFCFK